MTSKLLTLCCLLLGLDTLDQAQPADYMMCVPAQTGQPMRRAPTEQCALSPGEHTQCVHACTQREAGRKHLRPNTSRRTVDERRGVRGLLYELVHHGGL